MSNLATYLAAQLGGDPLTKTLSEILATVRFRGDFRNTIRFSDSDVAGEIQAAWAELYELVDNVHEGYWDTDTDSVGPQIFTVASQRYVALPSDAWRIRGIDRLDGSDYVGLDQIGIGERNRYGTRTGKPSAFRLSARGAELHPTPDAVYTLRVTYTPVAPLLDETGRPFYNAWEEFVVYGALVRLVLNQDRESTQWKPELEAQRVRITKGASTRRASEPEYLPLGGAGAEMEPGIGTWWWS